MTNTTTKTKAAHIKEIETIYYSMVRIMEGRHYLDTFFDEVRADEKKHRSYRPSTITSKYGLTVNQAAQYFVCRWILEAKTRRPKVEDYLTTKKAVFTGYAIYKMYQKEMKAAKVFTKKTIESISSFDYAEYI